VEGVAFRVGPRDCTWSDVLEWARRRRGWSEHVREVREGASALCLTLQRSEPLDENDVRAAAAAFRRQRRLISADDTERWLAGWRLSRAGWMDHLRRSLARERYAGELAGRALDDVAADEEARRWATGVCSGRYPEFAAALAERLAVAAAQAAPAAPLVGPPDGCEFLERTYADFRSAAVTEAAIADEVAVRRLDWIGFEIEWVSFPEEPAAREALLCVREDGDFSAVVEAAPAAATLPARERARLCQLEPPLRPLLLGARGGDAVGPLRVGDAWRVIRVIARTDPTVADDEVRRLAEEAVAARAVRWEVENRVCWPAPAAGGGGR
jgi:hypothetical protein